MPARCRLRAARFLLSVTVAAAVLAGHASVTKAFTCGEAHSEVLALALVHAAGQGLTRGFQGVESVPALSVAVSVGVPPNRAHRHGHVEGGGHGAKGKGALQQGQGPAAVATAGKFGACPFVWLGLEAVWQALFVGVEWSHNLRGLGTDAGALVGEPIAAVLPNITDITDVLIERRQWPATPRSVSPRRPSSIPAAPAVLRRKDARARTRPARPVTV